VRNLRHRHSQDNNDQNDRHDEQENACLAPRIFLVVARLLQVDMCTARGVMRDLDIFFDDVKLRSLLVHHVSDVAEELVELADGLLNIANLGFALNYERFLEVDIVLGR